MENISISKLYPHPDNPRIDLGDLTELAESIKVNGILQNLTVVPLMGNITGQPTGKYTVIIGHRRLAAAKLAGLEDVPCVISDMSGVQQIRTMLSENMQRTDLTVYEQAQGFQMMLDMGDSVEQIAERAGFSQTTVRRRVKLLELDAKKFKESVERGATLEDYVKLDQIEDVKTKNKVLEQMGTNNFDYAIKNAVDKERRAKSVSAWRKLLEQFATEVESDEGYTNVKYIYPSGEPDLEIPEDAKDENYYFFESSGNYSSFYLLKKASDEKSDEEIAREEQRKIENEKNHLEKEATKQAFELRYAFAKEYLGFKKHIPVLMEFAVRAQFRAGWHDLDEEEFAELVGITGERFNDDADDFDYELLKDVSLERQLFAAAYCSIGDDAGEGYFDWRHKHKENPDIDLVYDIFCKLGYQMSDEEKALQSGSHELFAKKESDDGQNESEK